METLDFFRFEPLTVPTEPINWLRLEAKPTEYQTVSSKQKIQFNARVAKLAPRGPRGQFLKHGYRYGMHEYFIAMEAR